MIRRIEKLKNELTLLLFSITNLVWGSLSLLLCFFLIYIFDDSASLKMVMMLPEVGLIAFFLSYSAMNIFDKLVNNMTFSSLRKESGRQISIISSTLGLVAFTVSFLHSRDYIIIIESREKLLIMLNSGSFLIAAFLNISGFYRASLKNRSTDPDD